MRQRRIVLTGLGALLILAYLSIVIANNHIARTLESRLRAYPLPADTEVLDSLSVAGKMEGNGNGMQYFGEMLVRSALSAEELRAHYLGVLRDGEDVLLTIAVQKSPEIWPYRKPRFDNFDEAANCFRIELFAGSMVGLEKNLWEALLNCDIRGH